MTKHVDFHRLLKGRLARREDEAVRRAMGLKSANLLVYGPYGTTPMSLWEACDGQLYVKEGEGQYKHWVRKKASSF